MITDSEIFNDKIIPINKSKTKFTFLSPQRIGSNKGIELLWEAISLCKSDFQVLQVEWFYENSITEKIDNRNLLKKFPIK